MKNLREPRSAQDSYHVYFGWEGRKEWTSTGTRSSKKARETRDAILERKRLYSSGMAHRLIPSGVAPLDWVKKGDAAKPDSAENDGSQQTVQSLIDEYLDYRQLRVESGQLSHASYSSDRYRLENFKQFCDKRKESNLAATLASDCLKDYKQEQLRLLKKGKTSPENAKHRLRTVKAMLLWAYHDEELIDVMPRRLKSYADIKLPAPEPKSFTSKEIETLYNAASPKLRLWVLLALNCGYTQTDVSNLTHDMIDWKCGKIKRQRQKTGVNSEHKLWQETITLLKQEQTDPSVSKRVLLTPNGEPLVKLGIKDDGSPVRSDSITHAFTRLRKSKNIDLPFKFFRKTGTAMIAEEYQTEPWLVELYLAHSDPRMRKHYTRQHFDRLHEATDWLRIALGIDKL